MEFWTLDGLERSRRPVGIISTYFRQKRSGGFRVMTTLKQIQILKNKIWDFITKLEFPNSSLLGEKISVFWPQIRIPCKKLYIWSNVGQNWPKSRQINRKN